MMRGRSGAWCAAFGLAVMTLRRRLAHALCRTAPALPALLLGLLLVGPLAGGLAGPAAADALDNIRQRGRVIVGVMGDYRPYGYLDSSGRLVGLEPELAGDVAALLGVDLELQGVTAANRMETLQQGRVDLLIATMADTPERRQEVEMVDPNYYAAGVTVLTKRSFSRWEDLEGVPVCSVLGAFYDREPVRSLGSDVVGFRNAAEALTALKQNRCAAFVYDETFIRARLGEPDWEGWRMPLPTIDEVPWGLAVREGEDALAALLGGLVVDWHISGRILRLEQKHGIEPTAFPQRMHDFFATINPGVER